MSFDSYYWHEWDIPDPRLGELRRKRASGEGGVDTFFELLRSDSVVAVGVALDHYRYEESLTRFGRDNPFEELEPTVLEVARGVLATPPHGMSHASPNPSAPARSSSTQKGETPMNLELVSRKLIDDDSLSVAETTDRIAAWLSAQPDRGAAEAVACLLSTQDRRVAECAALYLALLPGLHEEKTRAARRLRGHEDLVAAAGRLVPWLRTELLEEMVSDYVQGGDPDAPSVDVVYEVGLYQPGLLRPYLSSIEDPDIRLGMMSGAPDGDVPGLVDKWREEDEIGALDLLARMRTEAAAQALLGLREEISEPADWKTFVEMAGRLPDSAERAGHQPAYMGFVADRGDSPHSMGGTYPGEVPLCPLCARPTARVLTLSAEDLPYSLSGDPSFFWYTCRCYAADSVTVKITPDGLGVFDGPCGSGETDAYIVPGARTLTLETHPNQLGISLDATGGNARHQVGGLPRWITPEPQPRCPECTCVMRFLASIDSGPSPFGRMNLDGTLYGFWCDSCQVSSVRHQA
ncbi:hypothetical protein [Streptomyces sp. NPDC048527]|uniref:hypothetical protein n=1 Tax=Streptomyces sp. NPDC048527 TaxID=3365568 RepID=UPI00371BE70F